MRVFLVLLLLISAAAGAIGLVRLREPPPDALVEADVAGHRFVFPAALARDAATRSGGLANRLAFLAVFPEFTPRVAARAASGADGPRRDDTLVFITVTPRDEAIDPADRPARLYTRFLESEVSTGPGGLILRRFENGSPYEQEQLYLAPPDGRAFFARCPKRGSRGPSDGPACLWLLRWRSVDVELRFAPALLEQWELLVDGASGFLRAIDASKAPPRRR